MKGLHLIITKTKVKYALKNVIFISGKLLVNCLIKILHPLISVCVKKKLFHAYKVKHHMLMVLHFMQQ